MRSFELFSEAYMHNGKSKREIYNVLKSQLINERGTFKSHWRDLSDNILPRRGRFFVSDSNKGDKRNQKIIDSTATLASRTMRSGMMAGITSPARPWFKLKFQGGEAVMSANVKKWLSDVETAMLGVFLRSNLYNTLPTLYGDLGVFGTGCVYMEEDIDEVVRFIPFPIGSYMVANDAKLRVRVFIREFQMTVRQIIEKFATKSGKGNYTYENISDDVVYKFENGQQETWIPVTHIIMPNPQFIQDNPLSQHKKYISAYYEDSVSKDKGVEEKYLRESGYDYFPILAPRWEVSGEDVYGTSCPGMEALGDIRQLQLGEKRSAQAVEKMINPPMIGPTSLQNAQASILPGDITYVDDRDASKGGFRPAHEVRFDISALEAKQQQIRARIQRCFYEDLFLMLANSDRRQITAREIDERHEEKLLALGPVLEQLNQDLLDPLIENTFNIMVQQGLIPEPPEEIGGEELKIEYVSIMAQAQKLAGIGGIDRFVGAIAQAANFEPSILKKVDINEYADIYADLTGVPPKLVRSNDEVAEMEAAEQQAQQEAMQAEQQAQQISQAKELSEINTGDESALTELLQASEAGSGGL